MLTLHIPLQISQYSCDFNNLAPDGCTQYFYGTTSQSVRTYNYNAGNGMHLANQNQNICVRSLENLKHVNS